MMDHDLNEFAAWPPNTYVEISEEYWLGADVNSLIEALDKYSSKDFFFEVNGCTMATQR